MELYYPIILDGATGTQLQSRGYTGEEAAETWILSHPEEIQAIQRAYLEAGSQIVYAPTFGANRQVLENHRIFGRVEELNQKLAALSQEVAGEAAWVAGDISPTGRFLYPLGDASFEELVDIYTEQAAALEQADTDLFVIETMTSLADARAAVLAVRSVSTKPILVSFSCSEAGKTMTGSDITAALVVLQSMGISAFGLNCSSGPENMLENLRRLREYARVPLLAKPNAGLPVMEDGKIVYHCSAEEFVRTVPEMLKVGVGLFGGCCGSTPEHIAALRDALKDASFTPPAPLHSDLLAAASEKSVSLLPVDIAVPVPLSCTAALEDEIDAALEASDAVISIRINTWEDLDVFADCQYMITKPLCIFCEDSDLLESALRCYQGRALYEGSLSEELLSPLRSKYGLIT